MKAIQCNGGFLPVFAKDFLDFRISLQLVFLFMLSQSPQCEKIRMRGWID